ncbi:hypothetical protein [Acinetobacter baumannii]|uniref:hypothetical protein n=1 Tax=Acinetobacter baumannii TaxID=470 RepID=UPI001CDC74BB|nr:hypothetical protein [Acinetobacter baumannii]MCA4419242.1 hypothetical protein [Acinetobacter baumannii]
MFNNLLGSTDTAAVLGFIAFLILILMGTKNKNTGIIHSIFNIYQYFNSRKIEYLKNQLASPLIGEEDKKIYLNQLIVAIYQKELNLNENNLQKLRCIKRKIDSDFASKLYKNCSELLELDDAQYQFKPIEPIDPKRAKQLEKIGVCLFFASGLFAYLFLLYMLYIVDVPLHNLKDILVWAGINYFLMFAIIFIGTKILKFFMKQSNALKFIELSERNLDLPLTEYHLAERKQK